MLIKRAPKKTNINKFYLETVRIRLIDGKLMRITQKEIAFWAETRYELGEGTELVF